MLQFDLEAAVRDGRGKGAARKLRAAGRTPAVLYGSKGDSIALSFDTSLVTKNLVRIHGQNAVISLDVESGEAKKKYHVIMKEIQKDPVNDKLVHADFLEISMNEKMTLPVKVKYTGMAKGVDLGGILNVSKDKVLVSGLPMDIPDFLEADVTSLGMGDSLTCADLQIPENVYLSEDSGTVCITVGHPRAVVEEGVREEGAEAAEGAVPGEGAGGTAAEDGAAAG